ncbi:DNA-directed RNA polymerase subunit beta [Oceanobacillus halotolerans]|uniref:DNA-directed RNA polymerase subunit beta n=1 Tax=Oceanobacillus halotolerans TaxID=2663380 RepID=UPI0013DCC02F|nr:DNA-directed RNA polymerase subunit beta [Oceanobacillus halotolerans]
MPSNERGQTAEQKETRTKQKRVKTSENENVQAKKEESQAQTRKEQKKKQKAEKRKKKKPRRRIFPIWLRIIVVLLLAGIALIAGLMIGFGVLGDGNPTDVLDLDTWHHIIDIVTKEA